MADEQPNPATDVITVPAAELVRLREGSARLEQVERSTKSFVVGSQINAALAARTDLVPGAASKIARELRDAFAASPDGDGWSVQSRDGRGVESVLADYLKDPENQMFLRATARGGANGGGSIPAASGNLLARQEPQSLGERMIQANIGRNLGGLAFSDKYRGNR